MTFTPDTIRTGNKENRGQEYISENGKKTLCYYSNATSVKFFSDIGYFAYEISEYEGNRIANSKYQPDIIAKKFLDERV